MLTEKDVLSRWKRLAGDDSAGAWTNEDDVCGLLNAFRPDGIGCGAILEGIPLGEEITRRLQQLYAATRSSQGVYMIARPDTPLSREEVESLLGRYIQKWRQVCEVLGDKEGMQVLSTMPAIEWHSDGTALRALQRPEGKDWEAYLVDVRIDFMSDRRPVESPALLLREALYRATTSPAVQNYVLWPLYAENSSVEELYQEDFELWRGGIEFFDKDQATLMVCRS